MKNRLVVFSLLLAIAAIPMSGALVMASAGSPTVGPGCPDMVQQGELRLTIPAGSTGASAEQPIIGCAGTVVQASGGTLNRTPVIINAVVHHDHLMLSAFMLTPRQAQPMSPSGGAWFKPQPGRYESG